ncbi:MAG: hypothetical protein U0401_14445 [Anaerolineae bacterium]
MHDPIEAVRSLYQNFNKRADTLLDLVDALCSNTTTRSVVELSQSGSFRRSYSTIFKAINEVKLDPLLVAHLLSPTQGGTWPFWLLLVDVTSQRDRMGRRWRIGMVYSLTVVKDNPAETIGHQYSTDSPGLEREAGYSSGFVTAAFRPSG